MKHSKSLVKLFKALMHPARLQILKLLKDGEECVCHLEANLGYRQAYISQQLAVLRDAGLIEDRRDGWNIYYRVTTMKIYDLLNIAGSIVGEDFQDIPAQKRHNHKPCPCPKCHPESESGSKSESCDSPGQV